MRQNPNLCLRKWLNLLTHRAKSWDRQDEADLRKDWIQRHQHHQVVSLSLHGRHWWLQAHTLRGPNQKGESMRESL